MAYYDYKVKLKTKNDRTMLEVRFKDQKKFDVFINYDRLNYPFMEETDGIGDFDGMAYDEMFVVIMEGSEKTVMSNGKLHSKQ